jgi:TetR/AcrR family transcriptional regulator, cholesterol catabolism regulator
VAVPGDKRRRQRRRDHETTPAREAELLDAAAAMFAQRGYARTSISDLATALGIAKPSVYHYIRSKDELLYRVCRAVHVDGEEVVARTMSLEGSALERLTLYIREMTASNARNATKIAVYYGELAHLTGERRADLDGERARQVRLVRRLIDEAKAAGDLAASAPTQIAAENVLAQISWPYMWYRPGGRLSPEALGEAVARLAIGGLTL